MIEEKEKLSPDDMRVMHLDVVNLRAANMVPHLIDLFKNDDDLRIRAAVEHLQSWDFCSEPDSVAAARSGSDAAAERRRRSGSDRRRR